MQIIEKCITPDDREVKLVKDGDGEFLVQTRKNGHRLNCSTNNHVWADDIYHYLIDGKSLQPQTNPILSDRNHH
jgi:hypothetical protein